MILACIIFGGLAVLIGLVIYWEYLGIKQSRMYEGKKRETISEEQRQAEMKAWEERKDEDGT